MNEEQKELEIGDPIEIIGYGSKVTMTKAVRDEYYRLGIVKDKKPDNIISEDTKFYYYDVAPQMVGQTGFVSSKTREIPAKYSLRGVDGKVGWYNREQLKKI